MTIERRLSGIVLAAGAGSRMGRPKALMRDGAGNPWVQSAVELLRGAGCDDVTVVLGAAAAEARGLVPAGALVVEVPDWATGQAASLRAGLAAVVARGGEAAAADARGEAAPAAPAPAPADARGEAAPAAPAPDAVLITLVDLPELPVSVAQRVVDGGLGPGILRQAVFGGRPGHPVLIGRDHWPALLAQLAAPSEADRGARPYLVAHGVTAVECADLSPGDDVDTP
ncbi:hypothetical protein AX769_03100 [Frondihabitans sp. PAMC 28766]|uniref:nucleotidyltransferase family protein n=1 Tax=Frondihabitans sp. PAMC 28766 TaxID=1795630 RepID=UPI00078CD259|nr:nucleotidyltransferase family protein [Frondihabitans sp. PAMC 28766]AMM19305.1 hypothetical protein AX769_03100 [Frondihabitans sp. PAMC 28766]